MNNDLRIQRLEMAVFETERFIQKAKEALEDLKTNPSVSKPLAAAKRSAIDTAAALHQLNKSLY